MQKVSTKEYPQALCKPISTVIRQQAPISAEPYRVQSQAAMRTRTNRASVLLPSAVGAFHWKTLCFIWEKTKRSFSMTDLVGWAEIMLCVCVSVSAQKAAIIILTGNYSFVTYHKRNSKRNKTYEKEVTHVHLCCWLWCSILTHDKLTSEKK